MTMLTPDRLRGVLYYDRSSGRFYWRHDRGSRARKGDQAGSLGFNGYWSIRIDGKPYYEHRLAWLYTFDAWPAALDHINGNRWDNRIENLREATMSQNIANSRISENNSSGAKGVSWNKRLGKWHAYIMVQRQRQHLGFFATVEEAAAAYSLAAKNFFGEFARPVEVSK